MAKLESYKRILEETIRGLPAAAKKVGKAIVSFPGKVASFPGNILKKLKEYQRQKYQPENKKEEQKRIKVLERYKEIINEWKKRNPEKKIPKGFEDLE